MDREAIYAAFFTAITDAVDFKTQSRKLKHWNDVSDDSQQPALFQVQVGEVAQRVKGLPTKWTFNVKLYLYCLAPDDETAVTTIMNPLLDTIAELIDPGEKGSTNTLNIAGVSHVWIEGEIETDEGALGRQGVAIIPVSILVV